MATLGTVYVIHFNKPYRHALHYVGWASDGRLFERLREHARGDGARLMQVITEAGIGWSLARIYPGVPRMNERARKVTGAASRFCPLCRVRPIGDEHPVAGTVATILL